MWPTLHLIYYVPLNPYKFSRRALTLEQVNGQGAQQANVIEIIL